MKTDKMFNVKTAGAGLIKAISLTLAAALVAGCNSSGGGAEGLGTFPDPLMPDPETYQINPVQDASFATILNNVRLDAGSGPVTYNALLDQAAQGHADDMLANDYFSHTDLKGNRVGARVTATGYKWKRAGENLGKGHTSEAQVLQGWVNSPSHQAGQTEPAYEHFGLGRAGTGRDTRWVLVLADPK